MASLDRVDEVRRLLAKHLPGYVIDSIAPLGEGWINVAYEVNGQLIVRFNKELDPPGVSREARLLTAVAALSPVPVPRPAFADPDAGCLAYYKLRGMSLIDIPQAD